MGSVCSNVDDIGQGQSEVAGWETKPSVHITAYNTGSVALEVSGNNTNRSSSVPPGNATDLPPESDGEAVGRGVADATAKVTEDSLTAENDSKQLEEKNVDLTSNDQKKVLGPDRGGNSNSSNDQGGKETSCNQSSNDNNEASHDNDKASNDDRNCDIDDGLSPVETNVNNSASRSRLNEETPHVRFSSSSSGSPYAHQYQDDDNDSGLDGEDMDAVMSHLHFHEDGLECQETHQDLMSHRKMASFGELAITKPAPDFECNAVVNGSFQTVKLSSYRGKYVVLFFYPLDFTFVCPTEIIAFSDRAEEFRAFNCEVLACSTDSVYSHLAWIDTPRKQGGLGPMKIPLLADRTQEITKKYGCFKPDEGVAFRGLYIIDDKGNLRQITINDLPVGRSVDETLRLVQAFQFTDKHGEVCPAGWKPGKETMKPNPKESQKFFNKVN